MPSTIRGGDNFDSAGGNAVKAWVNFNGTGTVAIRAAFNVSSITDNGVGDYTVNFTTAMQDANYSTVCGGAGFTNAGVHDGMVTSVDAINARTTLSVRVKVKQIGQSAVDALNVDVSIFR